MVKGVVESVEGERGVGELNGKTREERRERIWEERRYRESSERATWSY